MDFHTLSRRDLQALCKKNKIPANITNVAMAESLQSLQTVEGLEEVLAHPATETPARSVAASKQPTLKNAQSSAAQQTYNTRRSTRILEKQMCHLSLKENDDMLDASATLQKDSQDMQRQFSADMESSLDLNDETTDETEVSKEATEEPVIVEVPLQHLDTVLENDSPTSERSKQLENVGDREEKPNLVDAPIENMDQKSSQFEPFMKLENDAGELEKSSNQKECKDEEVQPMQEDAVDLEVTQYDTTVVNSPQKTLSVPMAESVHEDNEFFDESDSRPIENAAVTESPMQEGVESDSEDNEFFDESDSRAIENAAVTESFMQEGVDQLGVDNAQNAASGLNTITMDEHAFGSEDTGFATGNMPSLHSVTEGDDLEAEAEVEQRDDSDAQSTEISDDEFGFLSESESESLESQSEEVELNSTGRRKISEAKVEDLDEVSKDSISNQSSCKKSDDNQEKLFSLQDENMFFVGTKTPVEKKSLRQLKKMVREKKEALRVHQENV